MNSRCAYSLQAFILSCIVNMIYPPRQDHALINPGIPEQLHTLCVSPGFPCTPLLGTRPSQPPNTYAFYYPFNTHLSLFMNTRMNGAYDIALNLQHVGVGMHVRTQACMSTPVYACAHTCAYVLVRMCMYAQIRAHAHTRRNYYVYIDHR